MSGRIDRFVLSDTAAAVEADLLPERPARRAPTGEHANAFIRRIARQLSRAQVALTVNELLVACGVLGAVGGIAAVLLWRSPVAALALAACGVLLPFAWLRWRYGRLVAALERQLPGTVNVLVTAVRAGHSLGRGLERIAEEAPEPTRSVLELAVREIGFGVPPEEALARVAERYPSDDLALVVAAISVQQKVGGSLPRVLELINGTIRDRIRIKGDIKSLTAQQRYSAYLLSSFPVLTAAGMMIVSPDYIQPMFDPGLGRIALAGAGALIVTGFLVMRSMGNVDV